MTGTREEPTTGTPDTTAQDGVGETPYQPPRIVHLGKSRDLIRGYWQTGTADYGTNWYITGE